MDGKLDYNQLLLKYLINFFRVIILDYDKEYNNMFKNALKYGMKKEDFWYGDNKEYYIYEDAYIERLHETSHIQGLYTYTALQVLVNNLFIDTKKGEKEEHYPDNNFYIDYKEKRLKSAKNNIKNKVTKDNLQSVYMNSLNNCY